ncbi:hypothetical protein PF006_g33610, partial [Phytophthora fragariae]
MLVQVMLELDGDRVGGATHSDALDAEFPRRAADHFVVDVLLVLPLALVFHYWNTTGTTATPSASFRGLDLVIKTLLPKKRKDLAHIHAFLAEVRLESLSDLFRVSEFMAGGDLRSL